MPPLKFFCLRRSFGKIHNKFYLGPPYCKGTPVVIFKLRNYRLVVLLLSDLKNSAEYLSPTVCHLTLVLIVSPFAFLFSNSSIAIEILLISPCFTELYSSSCEVAIATSSLVLKSNSNFLNSLALSLLKYLFGCPIIMGRGQSPPYTHE